MYPKESIPMDYSVDELSTDILGYLVKFSTEVMRIEDSIMDLVADREIGADPNSANLFHISGKGGTVISDVRAIWNRLVLVNRSGTRITVLLLAEKLGLKRHPRPAYPFYTIFLDLFGLILDNLFISSAAYGNMPTDILRSYIDSTPLDIRLKYYT